MKNKDLVSIIIPIYNTSQYIDETIKSIKRQTYSYYEAIFVDYKSTDNSAEIVKKYQKDDSRLKLIELKEHKGIAIARNIGIRVANGELLTFLDSDDIWLDNKLEVQINFLRENNYEFVYSAFRYMSDDGKRTSKKIKVYEKVDYEQALLNMRILTSTVMIDVNKIPKRYSYMPNVVHEDTATWWKILKKGYNAYSQSKELVYYRKTRKSRSSQKIISAKYRWILYRKIEGLSFIKSIYCFINYAINATLKRLSCYCSIQSPYK